ncbi:hypothetical protein NDU88_005418 [Pleurodeles waltl]|uniref:Uncharacterized protein n=1 Tax=Pleurodeles waltl TaxID=8319 RepID=A0AAV7LL98_PLEWA|nr:hypothetical protein NDU88_005418 [Pleurodeles waltl]
MRTRSFLLLTAHDRLQNMFKKKKRTKRISALEFTEVDQEKPVTCNLLRSRWQKNWPEQPEDNDIKGVARSKPKQSKVEKTIQQYLRVVSPKQGVKNYRAKCSTYPSEDRFGTRSLCDSAIMQSPEFDRGNWCPTYQARSLVDIEAAHHFNSLAPTSAAFPVIPVPLSIAGCSLSPVIKEIKLYTAEGHKGHSGHQVVALAPEFTQSNSPTMATRSPVTQEQQKEIKGSGLDPAAVSPSITFPIKEFHTKK